MCYLVPGKMEKLNEKNSVAVSLSGEEGEPPSLGSPSSWVFLVLGLCLFSALLFIQRQRPLYLDDGSGPRFVPSASQYGEARSEGEDPKSMNLAPLSSHELISVLKNSGSWERSSRTDVVPLVIKRFPDDLGAQETRVKKKLFINSMLPAVLMAMTEIQDERAKLLDILQRLERQVDSITLSLDNLPKNLAVTPEERRFLRGLCKKYRSAEAAELVKRVDVLPASLVMAQGALESSWGTSRFARLGNNIFGMWTWSGRGIVPLEREEGLTHKLAEYDSILDSVRDYLLTINRLPAYKGLRELRTKTMDPLDLATGLIYYSERREEYIRDLRSVISYNSLTGYDNCRLTSFQKVPSSSVSGSES